MGIKKPKLKDIIKTTIMISDISLKKLKIIKKAKSFKSMVEVIDYLVQINNKRGKKKNEK